MNKKKILVIIAIVVFFLLSPFVAIASSVLETEGETDVGIGFETFQSNFDKPNNQKPTIIDGGGDHSSTGLLPQTGEVITSLIVMLIGISVIVFIFGFIILKQLYNDLSWED